MNESPVDILSRTGWEFLYASERLGRSAWSNQPVVGETRKLRELCAKAEPEVIVELGSRFCGTALAFHDAAPEAQLFALDIEFLPDGDEIVDWKSPGVQQELGYENTAYHPKRSWFPRHVNFLTCDFVTNHEHVKAMLDITRHFHPGPLFMFVDGAFGRKPQDAELYADWLRSGDVMAVNNFGDEWQLADIEPMLFAKGYERWEFDWCEKVGMVLTRAWRKT